jgi:hypothetical protein
MKKIGATTVMKKTTSQILYQLMQMYRSAVCQHMLVCTAGVSQDIQTAPIIAAGEAAAAAAVVGPAEAAGSGHRVWSCP